MHLTKEQFGRFWAVEAIATECVAYFLKSLLYYLFVMPFPNLGSCWVALV